MTQLNAVLQEQQKYYDDRAPEYDDWWYRRNAFDEGPEANARWHSEVAIVDAALQAAGLGGDVLEFAGGTGIWSQKLLRTARTLTIVDGSAQMLSLNAAAGDPRVTLVQADIFQWQVDRRFDAIAFGFWISHVPRDLFEPFLASVASHLRPGGSFFFVDNCRRPEATAPHVLGIDGELMKRKLVNGKTSTIVKNYYTREEIAAACAKAGLRVEVHETPSLFQYGVGHRASGGPLAA
ncbi:class I SAM-dependent methyltransferase [Paracidovorax konjaci]|uniref:Methyltransferase domain-containing protein n=1 Tax=Paracidovorax konjaci TaxID=32040 RepID=A0A1I1U4Y5_9BURK|nr:class I SAM-dependent methyltransferase [Paracidovorax konjaci]SFD64678.1 Methyltransferase domain-containing protein [Paracidovorax konjaci]